MTEKKRVDGLDVLMSWRDGGDFYESEISGNFMVDLQKAWGIIFEKKNILRRNHGRFF